MINNSLVAIPEPKNLFFEIGLKKFITNGLFSFGRRD